MPRFLKKFFKANSFPWNTFKSYLKNSSLSELIVDLLFPLVLSVGLLFLTSEYINNFKALIDKFQQLSGQVIAAISILAGFNIASITIISTASESTNRLRQARSSRNSSLSLYDILISFFTWAVIIQLIVVLLGIILFYIASLIPNDFKSIIPLWAWCSAGFWLTITIHSMFISIRNMKTLYLYVTHNSSQPPNPTP